MAAADSLAIARAIWADRVATDTCDIYRAVLGTPTGYGGETLRRSQVATGVSCAVQRASRPQVQEVGMRDEAAWDWEILLPIAQAVELGDTITVSGTEYEVVGSDAGRSAAIYLKAFCTKGAQE